MKNVTTHETSLRLKAAGFPQPEPEAGQFWYDDSGVLVCIGFSYDPGGSIARFKQTFAFAPTAADILRELGWDYGLQYDESGGVFVCSDRPISDGFFPPDKEIKHTSPAEACAAAWLELKEQKEHNK